MKMFSLPFIPPAPGQFFLPTTSDPISGHITVQAAETVVVATATVEPMLTVATDIRPSRPSTPPVLNVATFQASPPPMAAELAQEVCSPSTLQQLVVGGAMTVEVGLMHSSCLELHKCTFLILLFGAPQARVLRGRERFDVLCGLSISTSTSV